MLYLVYTKRSVLIIKFPASCHLGMQRGCIVVPNPHLFIAIVSFKSRGWHCNATKLHFEMVALRKSSDQNKSIGVNYIVTQNY